MENFLWLLLSLVGTVLLMPLMQDHGFASQREPQKLPGSLLRKRGNFKLLRLVARRIQSFCLAKLWPCTLLIATPCGSATNSIRRVDFDPRLLEAWRVFLEKHFRENFTLSFLSPSSRTLLSECAYHCCTLCLTSGVDAWWNMLWWICCGSVMFRVDFYCILLLLLLFFVFFIKYQTSTIANLICFRVVASRVSCSLRGRRRFFGWLL